MGAGNTAVLPPHVRTHPLDSTLRSLFGDRLRLLTRLSGEAGEIGLTRLGRPVVLVNAPHHIHQVLVERADAFHKGPSLSVFARPVLGNGLLTSEDGFHRRQRKLVSPAFRHGRVTGYAPLMADRAERAQQAWDDGATLDIDRAMMRLTLGIVGKALFDTDVGGEADMFGRALTVAMHDMAHRMWSPLAIPRHWPTPGNRRTERAVRHLDAAVYRLIAERRAGGVDRGDLLSLLLLAEGEEGEGGMTDAQARDEAMTLLLAGHETTANALAWAWYLLARHPDVYAQMQHEVDAVLAGRTPGPDDLPNLPYTLQVFKEAMRLYPPAYAVARRAVRDVEIGPFRVPQGMVMVIVAYALHRRPEHFPEPERFDPERFTPEAEQNRPRYAYLPFGGGPRICIGSHFALMEGQILLATLAQRVTFHLVPGQRIEPEPLITLRPRHGIRMTVERRRHTPRTETP